MARQERGTWTPQQFREWRERMGYTLNQAAHVLDVSKPSIVHWENGTHPLDTRTIHMCESAEMLKLHAEMEFFGSALEVIRRHHAALIQRMKQADQMAQFGGALLVTWPMKDFSGFYVQVTWPNGRQQQVGEFKTQDEADAWIDEAAAAWVQKHRQRTLRDNYDHPRSTPSRT